MTRRLLFGAAVAGLVLASPVAAQEKAAGEDAAPQPVELTAQVVDMACKVVQDASGEAHRACAEACAKKGTPLGLLTSDGTLYLPVNAKMGGASENERLLPYAEQTVKVKGKVVKRGGMNAILIESVEKG